MHDRRDRYKALPVVMPMRPWPGRMLWTAPLSIFETAEAQNESLRAIEPECEWDLRTVKERVPTLSQSRFLKS